MIYENIANACKKKNWTIKELEEKSGLTNGTIGKWRKCTPRVSNLQKVAKTLGITVNTLLREGGSDEDSVCTKE